MIGESNYNRDLIMKAFFNNNKDINTLRRDYYTDNVPL
jgi:hypothetical protein